MPLPSLPTISLKSSFRATVILTGGSIVNMVLSLATAKALAVNLQPSGYGFYGLLQSFVGLATLATGLGMATAIVRHGAAAVTKGDQAAFGSLRQAAWLIFAASSVIAMITLAVFRVQISKWALGTPNEGATILLMSIALLFTVASNIQMGILNAHHCVGALAKYAMVNSALSAAITVVAVSAWHLRGVTPALIGGAICNWASGRYFLARQAATPRRHFSLTELATSACALLRCGVPFSASMLVGTGTQLLLPILVLHMLNFDCVGYYRAAVGISVGYLGFLATAMGQDYYPRLSAAAGDTAALAKLVNEQQRLVLLLSGPIILGTLAIVPYAVPLLYSVKFLPTVEILEWQLIGDVFKFSSWTMSLMILAHCTRTTTYFFIESISGLTMLATTYFGIRWFGVAGLGVSFVATYILYYFVVWVIARREITLHWDSSNKQMMLAFAGATLLVRALSFTRLSPFRTPIALTMALVAGTYSLRVLWRDFVAPQTHSAPLDCLTTAEPTASRT
jgi:antigen flippase